MTTCSFQDLTNKTAKDNLKSDLLANHLYPFKLVIYKDKDNNASIQTQYGTYNTY